MRKEKKMKNDNKRKGVTEGQRERVNDRNSKGMCMRGEKESLQRRKWGNVKMIKREKKCLREQHRE